LNNNGDSYERQRLENSQHKPVGSTTKTIAARLLLTPERGGLFHFPGWFSGFLPLENQLITDGEDISRNYFFKNKVKNRQPLGPGKRLQ
jgi:hypothetical protein